MAKQTKKSPSFDDFSEENLLDFKAPDASMEDEEDKVITQDEEEEEEVEVKPKGKKKVEATKEEETEEKPVGKKKKAEAPVEDEDQEDKTKVKTETEEEDKVTEETDPEVAKTFFEEVEKITGQEVDVDYGDVDPLSPQGVALRESAVVEQALDSWLEELEDKFPQVFRALKHANNGGDPAELFTQTTGRDYSNVEIKDGDDATAKQILTEYYKAKGIKSDSKIKTLLETDEDSTTGLVGEARAALEEIKAEQEAQKVKLEQAAEARDREVKKQNSILVASVDDVLERKQLGSFRITDRTEASNFKQYVLSNIRRTGDGKYEIATPLDQANIEKQLQYQYFQFKKGNLDTIIQQKVSTEKAKDLKLRLASEQSKQKKGQGEQQRTERTLNSFTEQ